MLKCQNPLNAKLPKKFSATISMGKKVGTDEPLFL